MIHLDTNLLIDLVTVGSPHITIIKKWLLSGEELAVCSIAWSEFLNGPHTKQQKDAVHAVIGGRVIDFTEKDAEQASRLFHYTGRKRGSHSDCMIAACAMNRSVRIATRNVADFQKFVPHGLQLLAVETLPS
jgi:predicted nucleic acid-binding protein